MSTLSTFLKYNEFGEPLSVLECLQEKIADPQDSEVLVKILASPINPADINTIEGNSAVGTTILSLTNSTNFAFQGNIQISQSCFRQYLVTNVSLRY